MNKLYSMFEITESSRIGLLPESFDYFFCSANSDERSYKSLEYIGCKGIPIAKNIIFDYKKLRPNKYDESGKISAAFIDYKKYSDLHQANVHECNNSDDDVQYVYALDILQDSTIGIDLTGFTVPDIFRLYYILNVFKHISRIHTFYTEPQHYIFDNDTFNKYTHLSGEKLYKPIEEYYVTGEKSELLVFFLGFDSGVSNYIFEKAQPQDTVVINGFPSYVPKLKDISLLSNYSLLTSNIDNEHKFYVKANNPFSAYNVLCDIRSKYKEHLMNICVLGAKPMALGACMFALNNLDYVKVTYPYPQYFLSRTTIESKKCWHYLVEI